MRKRATVVKTIHKVFTYGDTFGALSFGKFSPYAGDLLAIQLACSACRVHGIEGLQLMGCLLGALDVERKIGFFTYDLYAGIYTKANSCKIMRKLYGEGLIERVPFPETFSHIKRRVKCYRVSEKGHKCLRLFRDTYNLYQREVKRAKVNNAEGLK